MCGSQIGPQPQSPNGKQVPPPGGAVQYRSPFPYAYYPGQLPYGPPQPAKDDSLKKVIIFVVVFIAIVAAVTVIASLIFFGLISSNEGPPDLKVTVNLASPALESHERDGSIVWDATMDINRYSPKDIHIYWFEVSIIVRSASGSILLNSTSMNPDGTYDSISPISVEVWYIESVPGSTKMMAGDTIKITGMPVTYEGTIIELHQNDVLIGSLMLPTHFP
jgi:hypothetical protein